VIIVNIIVVPSILPLRCLANGRFRFRIDLKCCLQPSHHSTPVAQAL
jgi:hypothetical protein